ncbi:MAG: 50S ribosomal protein L10 [Acidobacteriota bacterium]|nr:50S ribosomal protein L10 [Acidobacteriota bacterium]
MVYTRSQKEAQVEQIREIFESANSIFLVDLTGLDSNEVNKLRAGLREKGARMQVIKNRLAKRAAGEGPVAALEGWFSGPTAMVYHAEEPVSTAKSLVDFAKDHPPARNQGRPDRSQSDRRRRRRRRGFQVAGHRRDPVDVVVPDQRSGAEAGPFVLDPGHPARHRARQAQPAGWVV